MNNLVNMSLKTVKEVADTIAGASTFAKLSTAHRRFIGLVSDRRCSFRTTAVIGWDVCEIEAQQAVYHHCNGRSEDPKEKFRESVGRDSCKEMKDGSDGDSKAFSTQTLPLLYTQFFSDSFSNLSLFEGMKQFSLSQ